MVVEHCGQLERVGVERLDRAVERLVAAAGIGLLAPGRQPGQEPANRHNTSQPRNVPACHCHHRLVPKITRSKGDSTGTGDRV